ncbi:MAG: NADH-quinone oxidoreductase subunit N [Thermodesulfovibrionales bacterium]|nr:NADH-quinone oxidoreductase subunit N [Thermodesulfovibrionales bacterium]
MIIVPPPFPNLTPFIPELIVLSVAMVLLLLEIWVKNRVFIAGICILTGFAVIYCLNMSIGITFNGMFINDIYSVLFKIIFMVCLILTVLISLNYIDREKPIRGEYYSLLLFATAGMMLMASAKDLMVLYLGLELMALSTYILAGIKTLNIKSNEAAIKYFMLGAFSSAFLLFGISMLYGLTATTDIYLIAERLKDTERSLPLILSMIMIVVAFSFKIAAAPFHMWSPDVYEGAPTSVTAFLSVGPKAAGFAVIGRVFYIAFEGIQPDWTTAFIIISVITMAIGNIVALAQTNIKRMLAYSSIAHAGYILIGIVTSTYESLQAVINYLMIYTFMNIGAFAIVILLDKGEEIQDYNGLSKHRPLVAAIMLLFMFSLVGIPPTAGFIAKFNLFVSAIHGGQIWLVVIAVIFSAVSAFYYLRVVMNMYMKDPLVEEHQIHLSPSLGFAIFITVVMVMVLGLFPSLII